MQINKEDIELFFKFLDPDASYFTVCLLDFASKHQLKGYGTMFETVPVILSTLEVLSEVSPTLHVTLNAMDAKGRRKEGVLNTRVLCVDIDEPIHADKVASIWEEFSPHLAVCSSLSSLLPEAGGKYHLYWKIENVPIEAWQHYQLALAQYFNGDKTLDTTTKTIRVPGVPRICKDGKEFMPKIIGEREAAPIGVVDLHKLFPWHDEYYKLALEAKKEESKRLKAEFKRFEKRGGTIDVTKSGRNTALWHQVYKEALECGKDGVIDTEHLEVYTDTINQAFSEECGGPLEHAEAIKTFESALRVASENMEKKSKVDKALLVKLEEIAQAPTNGFKGIYSYVYDEGPLFVNRFSCMATMQRVLQRYGKMLVCIDNDLYAFNEDILIWANQRARNEIISHFVDVCCRDIFCDPGFLTAFPGDKAKVALDKYQSGQFISSVITRVLSSKYIRKVEATFFDANPDFSYCLNGVFSMTNSTLREAKAEDYLLHRSNVYYDPKATCPRWETFMAEVFADNDDPEGMVGFMQELFGYSLTGYISEQKIYIHYGGGSNGKSKVLQALSMLMGGYATLMSGTTFAKSPTAFQKELERVGAKIEGKRVVIVDDMDTKTQWNEGLVKNLTGPTILARKLYAEERDVPNRAKFHLGCNDRPIPQSENYGILRRLCIIPYVRQFIPSGAKELELQQMLKEELSGIMNWALEGYRRMRERGHMVVPLEVVMSLEDYKSEHFTGESFIQGLFEVAPEAPGEDNDWHTMPEILAYVNEALERHGMSDKRLNAAALGAMLKGNFRCECRRVRVKGVQTRSYKIKFSKSSAGGTGAVGLEALQ
jgi:P4 family phage/plasmid primase-like protien